MGSAEAGPLHVGIGADGSRMPKALLVLFSMEDRWSTAETACDRCGDRRNRAVAAQRVPFYRPRRRQFLSCLLYRSEARGAARQPAEARATDGPAQREIRVHGPAGRS